MACNNADCADATIRSAKICFIRVIRVLSTLSYSIHLFRNEEFMPIRNSRIACTSSTARPASARRCRRFGTRQRANRSAPTISRSRAARRSTGCTPICITSRGMPTTPRIGIDVRASRWPQSRWMRNGRSWRRCSWKGRKYSAGSIVQPLNFGLIHPQRLHLGRSDGDKGAHLLDERDRFVRAVPLGDKPGGGHRRHTSDARLCNERRPPPASICA